jgi:hypothetical protein
MLTKLGRNLPAVDSNNTGSQQELGSQMGKEVEVSRFDPGSKGLLGQPANPAGRLKAAKDGDAVIPYECWDVPFWEHLKVLGFLSVFF